jgi:uncharacterized protein YcbK (DUF882 family)
MTRGELERRWPRLMRHPWKVSLSRVRAPRFKAALWRAGYVSPNWTRREWASKDGTAVPDHLRHNAQRQAFRLERLRHRLGDRAVTGISYYRSPAHNAAVGGATNSRHLKADATDFSTQEQDRHGRTRFRDAVYRIWRSNGIGTYSTGAMHADSRHRYTRW